MEKVLIVGESSLLIGDIYDSLGDKFNIQICEPNKDAISRMYKIIKPSAIVIVKTSAIEDELIGTIKLRINEIPIICICNSNESCVKSYSGGNMRFMFRPIDNSKLLNEIREATGDTSIDMSEIDAKTAVTFDGLFVEKNKKNILAIDDNALVLRGIKQLLDVDYNVTLATSMAAAEKVISQKLFNLILLDYEMPEIDGLEAYKLLSRNPSTMDTPIVFLTGVSDKKRISEVAMLDPKPAGYLLKPLDSGALLSTIKSVLANHGDR